MSTLFISHKSTERDNLVGMDLMSRLKELKHNSLFLDLDEEKGIVGGRSWEQTLYRNVRACRAVIALVSNDYLRSHWCFAELALARMEGKHLIPLEIEPLDNALIPQILTGIQRINLHADAEVGFTRLFKALEELDVLGEESDWDPRQSPYLGLSTFEEKHAPLFFGRDSEIRAGIELLDRGAPGLVMVLGSSGSGKSSLVRAGIVPRLHRNEDRWLVVGPIRPRRDPFAELAEALASAYGRYAPEEAKESRSRWRMRERLGAGADLSRPTGAEGEESAVELAASLDDDVRVRGLLEQLEHLSRVPPAAGGSPLRSFVDLSLAELRQMFDDKPAEQTEVPRAGASDLVEIADELRRASGKEGARVLLIVDQFEELLGHTASGDRPNQFLEMLREAVETEGSPLTVLGTMRSDFLGLFQQNRALLGIDYEKLSVGPMSEDGLTKVITKPAERGAVSLDEGLANRLLKDTGTPDALPLLSFTLLALWEKRDENGRLSLDQYKQLGGLQGAITREAQAILERHPKQEDDIRRSFLEMARLTEDGNYARKPVDLEDVPAEVREILKEFEDRRLLVTGQDENGKRTVEVAHEALFRSWPPLVQWLDENRADLLLRHQIERDAKTWQESNRAGENLWRGGRLLQARELERKGQLGEQELAFVRAGLRRRMGQRAGLVGITLSVIAVLAVLLIYAQIQAVNAEAQAEKASRGEAKANLRERAALVMALGSKEPLTGLVLAIQAYGESRSEEMLLPRVTSSLLSATQVADWSNLFKAHEDPINSVAISGDGTTIVSASDDGTVRLWDRDGNPIGKPFTGHIYRVPSVAISSDGKTIVSGGADGSENAVSIKLWDRDGNPIGNPVQAYDGWFTSVAISSDGKTIVSGSIQGNTPWLRLRDGKGKPIGKPFTGHQEPVGWVESVAITPDGKTIVSGSRDKTVRLWDREGNSIAGPFTGHNDWVTSVAISPDGTTIVSGSRDKTLQLWDREGNPVAEPFTGHDDWVTSVAISPDGTTIVSGSRDKTVRMWDREGNSIGGPRWHEDEVNAVSISLNGATIVSGSDDGTVRLWALRNNAVGTPLAEYAFQESSPIGIYRSYPVRSPWDEGRIEPDGDNFKWTNNAGATWKLIPDLQNHVLKTNASNPYSKSGPRDFQIERRAGQMVGFRFGKLYSRCAKSIAISPNGKTIVSASENGTVRLWDRAGNLAGGRFKAHEECTESIAISADGATIVSASAAGNVRLWDRDGKPIGEPFKGHDDEVVSVAISADGALIVVGSDYGTLSLWDRAGKLIGKSKEGRHHAGGVTAIAISRDGKTIVSGSRDKTVRLWDREGNPIEEPFTGHDDWVTSVAISPDGATIVSGSRDKTLRLWDRQGNLIGGPMRGHEKTVTSVAFSPDKKYIVSGSADSTVWLWDRDGKPMGNPFKPFKGKTAGTDASVVAFDGAYDIVTVSRDIGSVWVWQVGNPENWLQQACERVRNHDVLVDPDNVTAKQIADEFDDSTQQNAADTCLKSGHWSKAQQARFRVWQGRASARKGDVARAIASFQKARVLDAAIVLDRDTKFHDQAPGTVAKRLAADGIAQRAEILVDAVIGTYERDPPHASPNTWHIGAIVLDGGRLRWRTNVDKVSWSLTPDFANRVLHTTSENPYYGISPTFDLVVASDGQYTGFRSRGLFYRRTSENPKYMESPTFKPKVGTNKKVESFSYNKREYNPP